MTFTSIDLLKDIAADPEASLPIVEPGNVIEQPRALEPIRSQPPIVRLHIEVQPQPASFVGPFVFILSAISAFLFVSYLLA
jgi:hypothetical protein